MSDERRFPVHPDDSKALPRDVPWGWVETFRVSAGYVHGQTLERLAERGGLSWHEMLGHARGGGYNLICHFGNKMSLEEARDEVMKLISEWSRTSPAQPATKEKP